MGKVLIIGAGGVGTVVAHKIAQNPDVFTEIVLASRTQSKCDAIADAIGGNRIVTDRVDADKVEDLVALFKKHKPDIVVNVALPYQDLTIMDACLHCGVNYLDTANYEPLDEAKYEYKWQWAYRERFEQAGLTAILGCGFDPGVSGVYTAYAAKHYFKEMQYLDIVDCNAGNHGMAFATNFNPEIDIREITQKGLYWEDGKWIETDPLEIHRPLTYPNVGPRESYLLHHEELESLVKNYPTIKPENIISHKEACARGYASNHGDPEHWLARFGKDMNWFRSRLESSRVRVNAEKVVPRESAAEVISQLKALGFAAAVEEL